ncbi:cell division protein FtsK [Enterovibrio norvegicus]|uniref:DNA translocase FtsK n=2 Tax=Enterovibrio norvegicus TaxID=188144 RepID=A0A1I5MSF0_9GAMM|nr:DNA translocase FtsK 4TM domain-containing protein [Enterovibrio norvegicus]MCC4800405.1 DNA translocase FtsK 4TM domain-containing protein [Enterovibrio norvegicus]OEF52338.1 cell division protein FtsK [Enterovibrio norvegicus]OEF55311.1 cell division protein FtsK [Enterovibrio norvegicus]PMH64323.1 cell division protein FtsK [Enterovibrio norvegicus]PMI26273.1 cell division protein FtsK [Enterovibrio norvegicus]
MEFSLRQEHKQTETPRRLNGRQRLKETALILALLSAVFILVSLLSYDSADPSWSQTAWDGPVQNAAGTFGAWVADTFFFSLGTLAYPLPLLLVLGGWVFFRRRGESEPLNYTILATRILGVVLLFLTSCGLADLNFDDFWYFSSGGVVGDVLSGIALPLFNILGTTLVFLFLWAAGFTLFTGISWLTIVDTLGEKTLFAATWVVNRVRGDKPQMLGSTVDTSESVELSDADKDDPLFVQQTKTDGRELADLTALNKVQRVEPQEGAPAPIIHATSTTSLSPERPIPVTAAIAATVSGAALAGESAERKEPTISFDDAQVEDDFLLSPSSSVVEQGPVSDDSVLGDTAASFEMNDRDEPPFAIDENEGFTPNLAPSVDAVPQSVSQNAALNDTLEQDDDDVRTTKESANNESVDAQAEWDVVEESQSEAEAREIAIGNTDGLSELDRAQAQSVIPDEEDPFLETIREAQKNAAGATHPFLIKDEPNLPKPAEPLPTLDLLDPARKTATRASDEELQYQARLIETRLEDYKIKVTVKGIFPGPVITRFELELAPGVKVSRIMGLSKDIARSLSTSAVRVVDVIPGKPYIGLELPNTSRETVFMSEVVASERFQTSKSPLSVVLGKDIAGEAVVTDLAKAPHMLVAGTTGSGKSVGVNVMIVSMLYKAGPEDVRFIMIDPKMLELSVYEGIPHLLTEVVTDMKDAGNALRWCVAEMERRYKLMSALGVRNIAGFNDKVKEANDANHPIPDPLWKPGDSMDETAPVLEKLPYIVVIVDEFADLMMVVGKKVEELIARLAQKARAAGIHLVLATQRPSVDVITGLIKANIPTRMAFTVSTKTDSRTILDQGGAESLLGMGDMLFMPNGSNHPARVHGAFVNDDEVHRVVSNWKARGKPQYITDITNGDQGSEGLLPGEAAEGADGDELDQLFDQVVEFVTESRRASVSGVQRRFKIGYNRAARIVEQLEVQGIVSPPGHNSNREVLAPPPPSRD